MINREYPLRIAALKKFLTSFQDYFGTDYSASVCGSVGIGVPTAQSDIDFFIAIKPERIRDAINTPIFREVFDLKLSNDVLKKFEEGELLGIRPADNYFEGYRLSMNFFSLHLFTQLAQMYDFPITKFRFNRPEATTPQFRGFGFQNSHKTFPVPVNISEYGSGVITSVPSMVFFQGEPFFHINVDKFLTSYFLHDNLYLALAHRAFLCRLLEEFLNTKHENPLGFLYAYQKIAPWRLDEIMASFPENLKSKAFPQNTGISVKRQHQLNILAYNAHKIVVISGPGGIGKDSIAKAIASQSDNYGIIKPITTRCQRDVNEQFVYTFLSEKDFLQQRDEGNYFYWQYNGTNDHMKSDYYAIPFDCLNQMLLQKKKVLITVGGTGFATYIKRLFPACTAICLLPESKEQLKQQIKHRHDCTPDELRKKLQFAMFNMQNQNVFDRCIINFPGTMDNTIKQVLEVIALK